jgi:hypothetical protein
MCRPHQNTPSGPKPGEEGCRCKTRNFTPFLGPVPTGRDASAVEMLPPSAQIRRQGPRGSRTPGTNRRQPEPTTPTSRTPQLTTEQFHVLLNSLFKVLFNFPSRYLFAIGLGVIFSLTWSLPRALSCTPKQLDSREKPARRNAPPYGPITLYGPWPQSRWTWTGRSAAMRLSRTPHSARRRSPAVRCWAAPVSLAVTKGITVVFFSSAY